MLAVGRVWWQERSLPGADHSRRRVANSNRSLRGAEGETDHDFEITYSLYYLRLTRIQQGKPRAVVFWQVSDDQWSHRGDQLRGNKCQVPDSIAPPRADSANKQENQPHSQA